jgi:hypothetical protein
MSNDAITAAWESATMQNVSPLVSAGISERLWHDIVALRESGDIEAFATEVRALVATANPIVRVAVERAIAEYPSSPPPAVPSPAAPAASEE